MISEESEGELDDKIVESIKQFKPYRDELIDLISKIAKYYSDGEIYNYLHQFLEKIISYAFWPKGVQTFKKAKVDNYKFFLNEIYLYVIAVLVKYERFKEVNILIEQGYYVAPGSPDIDGGLYPFNIFRGYLSSLEHRNRRLNLNRISLMSDLLIDRATRSDISLMDLMQADYILFLRSELNDKINFIYRWFPHTLLQANWQRPQFEKFLRAKSKKYFEKFKIVLGVNSLDEFKGLLLTFKDGKRKSIDWESERINPALVINIDEIASEI